MLIDTNTLPMSQQGLVKIIDAAGILWQQGLQERMDGVGCDFLPNQSQADTGAVDVHIHP